MGQKRGVRTFRWDDAQGKMVCTSEGGVYMSDEKDDDGFTPLPKRNDICRDKRCSKMWNHKARGDMECSTVLPSEPKTYPARTKIPTGTSATGYCTNQRCAKSYEHPKSKADPEPLICEIRSDEEQKDWMARPSESNQIGFGNGAFPGSGNAWSHWEKCRHAPTGVFYIPVNEDGTKRVTYYGGSEQKVDIHEFDGLVVNLLGTTRLFNPPPLPKPYLVSSPGWEGLQTYEIKDVQPAFTPPKNLITIDWPDYGAPPVRPGFFKALHDMAVEKGIEKILFYCQGGHGRTGTALTATLIEVCNQKKKSALDLVHKQYCTNAVESDKQHKFLKDLAHEQ